MNVRGDGWASGRFLEVEPPRRIVFTWGWELEGSPLAPGSSVVEVELIPHKRRDAGAPHPSRPAS